jgi:nitrite reductase/ring-hydroxylating ferredoxin subunit
MVSSFYAHLLRYPPTRKFFLKKDGTIDNDYVELRMRHLTNFWLRTATGPYDDDYARYVDYVGRAHTSHGADPKIYIAERYVIGQVGFMQHAITEVLVIELGRVSQELEVRALSAWNKLMMVILEMLSRAYDTEREKETYEDLTQIDPTRVFQLAIGAFEEVQGSKASGVFREEKVARAEEIPDGERKIVKFGELSIGVFHHKGNWFALHNSCLHRGGPIATGALDGDLITCPWHGLRYNLPTGQLLEDPTAALDMYPVTVRDGDVVLYIPDLSGDSKTPDQNEPTAYTTEEPVMKENEFRASELKPGQTRLVKVGGEGVAVYNVGGTFFATQNDCTHAWGPLSEGELDGKVITCPLHGSRFDVTTGTVVGGPAEEALKTFQVTLDGEIARVEKKA